MSNYDRGELDKIIERSAPQAAPQAPQPPQAPAAPAAPQGSPWGQPNRDPNYGSHGQAGYGSAGYGHSGYGQKPYKKRKSWLEDIFD